LRDLEREGVITRYCKIWPGAGVPSAWVLHAGTRFSFHSLVSSAQASIQPTTIQERS
jgi:hypothetical protein